MQLVCANAVAYALISSGSKSRNFNACVPKDESVVRAWMVADEQGVRYAFCESFVQPKEWNEI